MTWDEAFPYTFKNLRKKYNIPEPSELAMVEQCRADDSELCLEMTSAPFSLTEAQMHHAASRYLLGKSRSGKTIYWMIDERGNCLDGHVGSDSHAADTWVSQMLKHRYPEIAQYIIVSSHCLFGLHLLDECHPEPVEGSLHLGRDDRSVAIVESERSAVILSELYPQNLWLATVHPANLNEHVLKPLQGHPIIMFPPTDDTKSTFLFWYEVANRARKKYHLDITVSSLLEDHATPAQKEQNIDLLDYYLYTYVP